MFKKLSLLLVTGLSVGFLFSIKQNNHQVTSTKVKEINSATTDSGYTIQDFCDYLSDKSEHYPLSDEFIEHYQQTSGGYIDYAKQVGILVDRTLHSPNQKWHFFTSWLEVGEIDTSLDAYSRIYIGLKCHF